MIRRVAATVSTLLGITFVAFALVRAAPGNAVALEGELKSLVSVNIPIRDDHLKIEEIAPTGSYTGVWQSSQYGVSGAAQMTINIQEGIARADIFLTGGEVTSATLSGTAHRNGENIWTMDLASKKPKLRVRGIFRGNSFVGDYTYARFLMFDQGQWVLKKE